MTPRISVVVPTYNRKATLGRAIDSVMAQTFGDFELIVVDDGSSDGTTELVRSYADGRIRLLSHSANAGQSVANNTGIEHAAGDLVAFLDSDDIWLPEYLSKVALAFERNPHVGFVYARLVDGAQWILSGDNKYAEVLRQGFLTSTIALCARKSALDRVGRFNPSYAMCNDDDLCFRLAREFSFLHIPEPLARAFGSPDSMSLDPVVAALGWEKLFLEYEGEIVKHCGYKALAAHQFTLAEMFFACSRIKDGTRHLRRGIASLFRRPGGTNPFSSTDVARVPFHMIRGVAGSFRRHWLV